MSSIVSPPKPRQGGRGRSSSPFGRYLALLEGLAAAPARASIRQIARQAGLAPATAHRLLRELLAGGIVYDDPAAGRFGIGARLWVLIEQFNKRDMLRWAALPPMQELRDRTGETVTLVTGFGRERVCILQVESRHPAHFAAVLDTPDRLEAGAPGKVLLAFAPLVVRDAYLDWVGQNRGESEAAQLRAVIEEIAARGHLIGYAERAPEFGVVSVPVIGPAGALAALSVVGPASRWSPERAAVHLPDAVATAQAIGRAFGSG
ncbi:MAG: IclR family transcriptional regulator [Dehalococcoidia bacterium]